VWTNASTTGLLFLLGHADIKAWLLCPVGTCYILPHPIVIITNGIVAVSVFSIFSRCWSRSSFQEYDTYLEHFHKNQVAGIRRERDRWLMTWQRRLSIRNKEREMNLRILSFRLSNFQSSLHSILLTSILQHGNRKLKLHVQQMLTMRKLLIAWNGGPRRKGKEDEENEKSRTYIYCSGSRSNQKNELKRRGLRGDDETWKTSRVVNRLNRSYSIKIAESERWFWMKSRSKIQKMTFHMLELLQLEDSRKEGWINGDDVDK